MHEREILNLQRDARMRTTIYLATACGLAVIQGCDESWVGEVCLNDKQIQCVAADRTRKGVAYCGTFGNGIFRSSNRGATWHPSQNLTEPNVMALASSQSGALYAGTELSAMYRSDDGGESWCELETLLMFN
jgi:ligand-binding sensor domain-containing protein